MSVDNDTDTLVLALGVGKIAEIKPERLFPASKFLPDDVRKLVIRLVKLLHPYERYAATVDWTNERDIIDLHTVLSLEGVYGEELRENVERLSKRIFVYMRKVTEAYAAQTDDYNYLNQSVEEVARQVERAIMKPIITDGRHLASECMAQAMNDARVLNIRGQIRQYGADAYIGEITRQAARHRSPNFDISNYEAWWFKLVNDMPAYPDPQTILTDERFSDAAAVLSEVDLRPTTREVPCAVPRVFRYLPEVSCALITNKNPIMSELAVFIMRWAPNNSVDWRLYRDGCHISNMHSRFLPSTAPFVHANKLGAYECLRRDCTLAVLRALECGQLEESSYVDDTDFATRLELSQLARLIAALPERPDSPEPAPERQPDSAPPPLVFDRSGSMGTGKRVKREQASYRPRTLSWRRIMGALSRFGVKIDFTTNHPKLVYRGHTAGFLNRHSEEDPAFNRQVLDRTLVELGIDHGDFYRTI